MQLISYKDYPDAVRQMCVHAYSDKKNRAFQNFSTDYEDKPHTLLWHIDQGTYRQDGDYLLLFDCNNKLMGGAGYYRLDDQTVMAMSRFYVMPGFENQWIGQHFIGHIIEQTQTWNSRIIITFNEYNRRIYDFYVDPVKKAHLPAIWQDFQPVGIRHINYTDQYCCEYTPESFTPRVPTIQGS